MQHVNKIFCSKDNRFIRTKYSERGHAQSGMSKISSYSFRGRDFHLTQSMLGCV